FDVDFDKKDLTGSILVAGTKTPIELTATIKDDTFQGISTDGVRTEGGFYGEKAEEISGQYSKSTNPSGVNEYEYIGSFGAKK
ncbi:MAG: transferrin-binding protein-like solute binding protein, partial [Cardiobacteriaceae bacterium]|nr:transferrin-binding protein-like solute binding protein [Cardiobacteriaceae bacterium]